MREAGPPLPPLVKLPPRPTSSPSAAGRRSTCVHGPAANVDNARPANVEARRCLRDRPVLPRSPTSRFAEAQRQGGDGQRESAPRDPDQAASQNRRSRMNGCQSRSGEGLHRVTRSGSMGLCACPQLAHRTTRAPCALTCVGTHVQARLEDRRLRCRGAPRVDACSGPRPTTRSR